MTAETQEVTSRKLATVETIASIHAIPEADAIERARIRGWDVVVKKGEFTPGDPCVYFEIDSFLNVDDPRFAFLAPRGVRTAQDGSKGHVLKTARLRGVYSQGLALPVADFPEVGDAAPGADVTDALGVTKWEPPIPAGLESIARGPLPSWIRKTDEERIQNIPEILGVSAAWVSTEKVDGSSMTIYVDPSVEHGGGVCSRNLDLLPGSGGAFWDVAERTCLRGLMERLYPGQRAAIQGEMYGEGIQGNPLKIQGKRFAAFSVIVDGVEVPRSEWPAEVLALSVPIVPGLTFPATVDQALADVDTLKSQINPSRAAEGVVWRATDAATVTLPSGMVARGSFKIVSNRYLLKADR